MITYEQICAYVDLMELVFKKQSKQTKQENIALVIL